MSWFRVDDKFAFHAKAVRAGNAAIGVWVRLGAWSSDQLTDGKLPGEIAKVIEGPDVGSLDRLCDVGLLEREGENFAMHDFLDWNPSGKQVKRQRKELSEARSKAGSKGVAKREANRKQTASPSPSPDPIPIPEEKRDPPVGPPPSKPAEPGFKLEPPEGAPKRRKPETAIPDGWGPSAEHLTLGRSLGFDEARVKREGEKFADGARAKDRRYVDWHAAFANWLRNEQKYAEQRGEKVAPLPPPEPPPKPPIFVHRPRFPREPIEQPPPPPTPPEPEPEDDGPEMTPEELRALKDRRLEELRAMDLDRPNGAHDGR